MVWVRGGYNLCGAGADTNINPCAGTVERGRPSGGCVHDLAVQHSLSSKYTDPLPADRHGEKITRVYVGYLFYSNKLDLHISTMSSRCADKRPDCGILEGNKKNRNKSCSVNNKHNHL